MLKNYIHTIGLGIIAFSAGNSDAMGMTARLITQQHQFPEAEPTLETFLADQQIQLVIIAGLLLLLVVMIAVLFKRYRTRAKTPVRQKEKTTFYHEVWKSDSLAFSPAIFSSESSPAILVAHHDNDLRLFLTNTLRLNYRVISVSDGEEAFEKAFELVPDLVITDRFMPGMDGLLLARRIKTSEATSHIPIIVLVPENQHAALNECAHYVDDHLSGVFDARDLLLRVHKLINRGKSLQDIYRKQIHMSDEEIQFSLPEQAFLFKLKVALRTYGSDPVFGVEQLTDQLHMTRLQLFRKLKALTMFSPGEFIKYYRIERSKQLLKEGLPLAEVAAKSGFANEASFTKAFRDLTGKKPVEFSVHEFRDGTMVED